MKCIHTCFLVFMFVAATSLCDAASSPKERDIHNDALLALKAGDTSAAVDLFTRALSLEPSNYRYYNDRGVAYKRSGALEKAVADYSKALEIKPDYTNALNNRGVVYTQQGLYDKAVQDFTEALKLGEMKGKLHMNLGTAFAKAGEHEKAVAEFDAGASYQPLDTIALLILAESLEKIGNNERALKVYQLSLGLTTDTAAIRDVQRKMAVLEKTVLSSKSPSGPSTSSNGPVAKTTQLRVEPSKDREILLAQPKENTGQAGSRQLQTAKSQPVHPAPPVAAAVPDKAAAETPKALAGQSRARALEKFSPASAEIYNQGLQFLEQSDPAKALIRFEDSLQLEKRHKNTLGMGWSVLEIGRVHASMGDHARAAIAFEDALKVFTRIKASDETILTLLEAASNRKRLGQMDKAQAYYGRAMEEANSRGLQNLAKYLGDLAAGKTPVETPSVLAADKPKGENKKLAAAHPPKVDGTKPQAEKPLPREPLVSTSEPVKYIQMKQTAPRILQTPPIPEKTRDRPLQAETRPGQDSVFTSSNSQKLADIGKGPAIWGESGKSPKTMGSNVRTQEKSTPVPGSVPEIKPDRDKASATRSEITGTPIQPKGPVQTVTSISADLAELKKYRDGNDDYNMMLVLDRLTEKYYQQKEYSKALHAITASLAFRDKLSVSTGLETALEYSGLIREQVGDQAAALEDFSRAIYLQRSMQGKTSATESELRAKEIATRLGMDYPTVIAAFQVLWKARRAGDNQAETEALYLIGRLYDRADKPSEALKYYERSSASMLADKARIYEKIGKADLAEQSYIQALEAFKKFDYFRYLDMKKKWKSKILSLH